MSSTRRIQYTIRGVPDHVDNFLRQRARGSGKSLNEMALAALMETCGNASQSHRFHDLDDLSGTWVEGAEGFDAAMATLRQTEPDIWR